MYIQTYTAKLQPVVAQPSVNQKMRLELGRFEGHRVAIRSRVSELQQCLEARVEVTMVRD